MNRELLQEAQKIQDQEEKIEIFSSRFKTFPLDRAKDLHEATLGLIEQIPDSPSPTSMDEVHEGELKRRLLIRADQLDHNLRGKAYTLDEMVKMYGLETSDLSRLQPWLQANKKAAQDAVAYLFDNTPVQESYNQISTDIPEIRTSAEKAADDKIADYHKGFSTLLEENTAAGHFAKRIKTAPTTRGRSYFSPSGRLALAIESFCYQAKDETIKFNEKELIHLYGHEAMGHGLQWAVTNADESLPFFARQASEATVATEESIAMHYERIIFEDLRHSKDTQKKLGIADKFDDIYQEKLAERILTDFNSNLFRYSILLFGDTSLGNPRDPESLQRRVDLLSEVTPLPGQLDEIIGLNMSNLNGKGMLGKMHMRELRYASQAAERGVEVFSKNGFNYAEGADRSRVDMTFLTGYYTPQGFVQKAELAAKK